MLVRLTLIIGSLILGCNLSAQVKSINGIPFGSKYEEVKRTLTDRGYEVPLLDEQLNPFITLPFRGLLNGLKPTAIVLSFSLDRELVGGSYAWSIKWGNSSEQKLAVELLTQIEHDVVQKYGLGKVNPERIQELFTQSEKRVIWRSWSFNNDFEGGDISLNVENNGMIILNIVNARYFVDAMRRDEADQL
jgi:hypothetical protein